MIARLRFLATLVTIAAVVAVVSPSAPARTLHAQPCANAGLAATQGDRSAVKAAVVCLINRERTSRGLPALRVDPRLDRSAQHWSSAMVASGNFSHGSDFGARIRGFGFNWSAAGENIATGYPTASSVVAGWMASTGHCQNILSPEFAFVGTGFVPKGIRPFGTGGATWTQDFGLQIGARAPSRNSGPANGCPYKA